MNIDLFGSVKSDSYKRTLRIPYIGSKNLIANQIIETMLNATNNRHRFIDAFCGGGAISYGMLGTKHFKNILANDINKELIQLHNNLHKLDLNYVAKNPCLLIDNGLRKFYPFLKHISEIPAEYKYVFKIVYSFGNDTITNLWGKNIKLKYKILWELFNDSDKVSDTIAKYLKTDVINFKFTEKNIPGIYNQYKYLIRFVYKKKIQLLERLQALERLEALQQLQAIEALQHNINFISNDYKEIKYLKSDVVYFDPPYSKSKGDYYLTKFNNIEFYKFAKSLECPVFISEYEEYIPGFKQLIKIPKLSILDNKNSTKATKQRYEYLHYNGK